MQTALQPVFEDVLAAAARIAPHAHATPVLRSRGIDAIAGCSLHFKAEPLQRAGAFKFRGACNAVWSLDDAAAARGVVERKSVATGKGVTVRVELGGRRIHKTKNTYRVQKQVREN